MTDLPQKIDRDRVRRLIDQEHAQLVEVLSANAFEALHLPNALNIPLWLLNEKTAQDLDRSKPVIVYCYDQQ